MQKNTELTLQDLIDVKLQQTSPTPKGVRSNRIGRTPKAACFVRIGGFFVLFYEVILSRR